VADAAGGGPVAATPVPPDDAAAEDEPDATAVVRATDAAGRAGSSETAAALPGDGPADAGPPAPDGESEAAGDGADASSDTYGQAWIISSTCHGGPSDDWWQANLAWGVTLCYRAALLDDPALTGELEVLARVSASHVVDVTSLDGTPALTTRDFQRCVGRAFRHMERTMRTGTCRVHFRMVLRERPDTTHGQPESP
jgi:hypothetical protein